MLNNYVLQKIHNVYYFINSFFIVVDGDDYNVVVEQVTFVMLQLVFAGIECLGDDKSREVDEWNYDNNECNAASDTSVFDAA